MKPGMNIANFTTIYTQTPIKKFGSAWKKKSCGFASLTAMRLKTLQVMPTEWNRCEAFYKSCDVWAFRSSPADIKWRQ